MKYCVTIFLLILCFDVKLMQAFHITTERVVITAVSDTNDVNDDAATIGKHNNSSAVTKQQNIWLVYLYNAVIKAKQRLQESVIKRGFGKLKKNDNDNVVDSLPMRMPMSDGTKNVHDDEGNRTAGTDLPMELLQSVLMLVMLVMNIIILLTVFGMMLLHKCSEDDNDFKIITISKLDYEKL